MGNHYEDRADIIDLMSRYAWAVEERDHAGITGVFTPDATANIRDLECEDRNQIATRIMAALLRFQRLQHVLGNHLVEIDGDHATHRCQMIVQQSAGSNEDSSNYIVGCVSHNKLARTPEGWRFTEMTITETWSEGTFDPTLG